MASATTAQSHSFSPHEPLITDLPFVTDKKERKEKQGQMVRCFWDVTPTGDYARDCTAGENYAVAAMAYSRRTGSTSAIDLALQDMSNQDLSGIEIAFIGWIARAAMS